MRALAIRQFGDRPVVMELPAPEPGPGEVQVNLTAASSNPLDFTIATGEIARNLPFLQFGFPLVVGVDGAGTVSAVGVDVAGLAVGDRVFGQFWGNPTRHGTFAETTVVAVEGGLGAIAPTPNGVSDWQAAALPTAGFTALGAVESLGSRSGQTVLVVGATGGVGTFAVQLLAAAGVRVVATAAADAVEGILRIGAADTIDYRAQPLDEAVSAAYPDGVDGVLDLRGDRSMNRRLAERIRDDGAMVSVIFGVDDELQADTRIRARNYRADRKPERLREIGRLVAAGEVQPVVDQKLSLEEAARLFDPSGTAHSRGKTVVQIVAE